MAATTPTAVREALATAIEALVPASVPTSGFIRYEGTLPFADHVEAGPAHAWRRFDLRFLPAVEAPMVTNPPDGRWRYPFELSIAYPRAHYKGVGTKPTLDIDQIADEDFASIWPVLRDHASASLVAEDTEISRETTGDVTMLDVRVVYEIWRSV